MYVQRAKTIPDQLAAFRSPVLEDDLITYITEGHGFAYRLFTRALEARLDSVLFNDPYVLLLSDELQLARDVTTHDSLNASTNYCQRGGCGQGTHG